jgi:hypothetical protein
MGADYATDFYGWTIDTARKLRAGELADVDLELVAEEIESLGKSEQQQLSNRLIILLTHMLKWEFQPSKRKSGWQGTMIEQRERIKRLLAKNPSLRPVLDETIAEAYSIAVTTAAFEAHMIEDDFPRTCPYVRDEILPEQG